jgi:LmbE family N-acetylglucosaminyl deacetylase
VSRRVFVPDGVPVDEALARTTHLAIGAHPDDIPIMAYHGVVACYRRSSHWFTAVTVTDGAGSPRGGSYAAVTDDEMARIRAAEEIEAARIGRYGAAVLLGHRSDEVCDPAGPVGKELVELIDQTRPRVVYTHNLADRHDTHVAVAVRTIEALREAEHRPGAVYGCEVWRDLDWLDDRVELDVGTDRELALSLLGVYRSQIEGGKRYDLAVMGRRQANATFGMAKEPDRTDAVTYAMDLTPLVRDPSIDLVDFLDGLVRRFAEDAESRLRRVLNPGL